jgi:hypothetical protein
MKAVKPKLRFTQDNTKLNSLIKDCSMLQASVSSFKLQASSSLSDSKAIFDRLKVRLDPKTPGLKWNNSDTYLGGKALLAAYAKTKAKVSEDRKMRLVSSLLGVTEGRPQQLRKSAKQIFVGIKDVQATSKLLALNKRKFGESFPTALKRAPEVRCKSRLKSESSLDEILMQDFKELQKERMCLKSEYQFNETQAKHRYILADDQVKLAEVITKASNPVQKLILKEHLKFKPMIVGHLYHRSLLEPYRDTGPKPEVTTKSNSQLPIVRSRSTSEVKIRVFPRSPQHSRTVANVKCNLAQTLSESLH